MKKGQFRRPLMMAGYTLATTPARPDLGLLEFRTLAGSIPLTATRGMLEKLSRDLASFAATLAPDRSAS